MLNKIKIPIALLVVGISILITTFLFISHFIISGAIMNMEQSNYAVNINAINKPVVEKIDVDSTYPFNFGSIYMGVQGNDNIEIKNIGSEIEEFSKSAPKKVYILKSVSDGEEVGVQFNRYYNNKFVGKYNMISSKGNWIGVYTNNNNDIANVNIK